MNKNRPVLVILSPGFPENEADTTCLPAQQDLVRLLRQIRPSLELVIIAFQYPFTGKSYQWNGVPVIPLNGRNRGKLYRLLTLVRAWYTIKRIKKDSHIIGLFSFWLTECAFIGKWFGFYHRIRHHCWMLGQDARPGNKYVRYIRPTSEELVALSDFLVDEFYRNYGIRPAHVVPSGIDPNAFASTAVERTIDLLAVGSLIPLKQYAVFLQTVYALKEQLPNVVAVICGKGPEKAHLEMLIRKYGLEANVRLTGECPHNEVLHLMQQSRILLHPSSYEGFGTVCLEALYAGAQVISFCRPMKAAIAHWYIVAGPDEMIEKTRDLLLREPYDNTPVMTYSMLDNARSVLRLFPYQGISDVIRESPI